MTVSPLRSVSGIAARAWSLSFSTSRNSARLPRGVLGRRFAVLLHQRDETRPVKHCGARPQVRLQIVSSVLTLRPQRAQVSLIHGFTPYIEVLCSSSNARAAHSRLATLPQSWPSQ